LTYDPAEIAVFRANQVPTQ